MDFRGSGRRHSWKRCCCYALNAGNGTGSFHEKRARSKHEKDQGQESRMPCGCLPDEATVQSGVLSWPTGFGGKTGGKRPFVVT